MKKKYSTLLNFALATCVATTLVACSGDGDFTGSTGKNYTNPKIDIGGVVVDTNGNSLAGVNVSCQGSNPVKTNELGTWIIRGLKVTNVAGADDYTSHPSVSCVVEKTSGYLGAIVHVYPEAQIDDTPSNWEDDLAVTNPRTTFIDGMYAEAGTAWLPALGSTITGRLENCNSEESMVGKTIRLDMLAVDNNVLQSQAGGACNYGCSVDYSTAMYSAVTGADGKFTISNVPDDSVLRLYVEGEYKFGKTPIDKDFVVSKICTKVEGCAPETDAKKAIYLTTINEGWKSIGDVCVEPIIMSDNARPCVDDIEGWVIPAGLDPNPPGGYVEVKTPWGDDMLELAVLHDNIDGTGGIDISFNESLQPGAINANSVVIWDMDDEAYITDFSSSITGSTLTITTDEPIPDGHRILAYLLRDDFRDLAGNFLYADDLPDNRCNYVRFAEEYYSKNGTAYVVVGFRMYAADDTNVGPATDLAQKCTDPNYTKTVADQVALQALYPTVFRSEVSSDYTFYNLNADADYEYRLEALADVLQCPNEDNSASDIVNGYATVSFMAPDAGGFEVSGDGDGCSGNCDGPGDGAAKTAVINGVSIGDEVCVDSIDDFDNYSGQICITLGDCVAPTTVLNYAYNTCGHIGESYSSWETNNTDWHAAGPGGSGPGYDTDYAAHLCVDFELASYFDTGDGGENTNPGIPGACGIPTLNITCRLLKDPVLGQQGLVTEPIDFYGLYMGGADGQIPAPGSYGPTEDFSLYDATDFAGWVPFADTIGVAFSENIRPKVPGAIVWTGETEITSWTIGNNIGSTDDGDTPNGGPDADDSTATSTTVDLVQITVDDVLTLANVDHQKIMDFTDAVEDLAGNQADHAVVAVNDLMPPFVEYAYWDGGLTIKFNETVAPCIDGVTTLAGVNCTSVFPDPGDTDSDVIVLWDTFGNGDLISLTGATLSDVDGGTDNLLTIPAENLSGITGDENFPSTTDTTYALVYDEDIYDDLGFTGPYQHGAMSWGFIPDARGNRWFDYDSVGGAFSGLVMYRDTDGTELCNMPSFAVADVLGPFTVTGIGVSNFTNTSPALCTNAAGSTGTMPAAVNHVMSYSMSHPVNLERQYWEDQDGSGSIDCTAINATDLCTLAEVNAGMTNAAWVDTNVRVCTTLDCATTTFVGDVSYLTGVSAHLNNDRMSMTITVQNNANPCYNWATNNYLLPVWNVWSAFNVGTFKQLNLQGVP